jgi:hypothetical protein
MGSSSSSIRMAELLGILCKPFGGDRGLEGGNGTDKDMSPELSALCSLVQKEVLCTVKECLVRREVVNKPRTRASGG